MEFDARGRDPVAEGVVVEHRLGDRLAVVESAFDGDGVHVAVGRGRHHAPLHVGDAAVREQHEQVGAGAAAETRLDGGAAEVSPEVATMMVVRAPRAEGHGP